MRCMVGNWEESSRERRTGVHGVSSRRRPRLEKKKKKIGCFGRIAEANVPRYAFFGFKLDSVMAQIFDVLRLSHAPSRRT